MRQLYPMFPNVDALRQQLSRTSLQKYKTYIPSEEEPRRETESEKGPLSLIFISEEEI